MMKSLDDLEMGRSKVEKRRMTKLNAYIRREEWYELYLDDFTMIVLREDLFRAQDFTTMSSSVVVVPDQADDARDKKDEKRNDTVLAHHGTSVNTKHEEAAQEYDERKLHRAKEEVMHLDPPLVDPCTIKARQEQDAQMFLQLTVKTGDQRCPTFVDAQCGICLTNAQEGDEMVLSDQGCRHVYHRKCILPWLASGKKRCPFCRHWLVPSKRIWLQRLYWRSERERQDETNANKMGLDVSSEPTPQWSISSSCHNYSMYIPSAKVMVRITHISGPRGESFAATCVTYDSMEFKPARGEDFFLYPPGKWIIVRSNSNGYFIACGCNPPVPETLSKRQ